LPNRSYFDLTFNKILVRAKRYKHQCAIMLLVMKQFKQVNDSYGHLVGDQLLKEFAKRLKHRLKVGDMVARLGGEEFVVLIEEFRTVTELAQLSQHLLEELRAPYAIGERIELVVTVSIGISLFPDQADDSMRLLRNADTALYLAKSKGHNTYCFYSEQLTCNIEQRMILEGNLRTAIKLNQFVVYYQPLVSVKTNNIMRQKPWCAGIPPVD
jgi:diguanylate cyclase (GGDEF)-like protein